MPSPLCRCRTLYIGSAVPTVTKDGLEGIQEPLRERYPVSQSSDTRGIDSWLSVWSNGLLLEYVQDAKEESRFFPIQTLHYCAAVRFVNVSGFQVEGGGERFLPLDSPFAQGASAEPPIFAAILRRTSGIKVLECHAFICTNPKAANALVSSCFRAYADSVHVKVPPALAVTADETPVNAADAPKANGGLVAKHQSSTRASTPEKDNGYARDNDDSGSDREILRWPQTEVKSWQRRQQGGDIDAASLSSSLAGRYRKRERLPPAAATLGRYPRTRSEVAAPPSLPHPHRQGRAPLPLHYRRSNSDADLLASHTLPPRMAPVPPPHFMGPPHQPPPHLLFPPPPPHPPAGPHFMAGPPPPPPPHMFPPHPPHIVPPHVIYGDFRPPMPPHMLPPQHLMGGGGTISKSTIRSTRGPIIEEPVYMAGSVAGTNGGVGGDGREASLIGGRGDGQVTTTLHGEEEWRGSEHWDSPIYQSHFRRQPYINERAFAGSFPQRPPSPPVDYDRPHHNANQANHPTSVVY